MHHKANQTHQITQQKKIKLTIKNLHLMMS
jgi:hypothetical protein